MRFPITTLSTAAIIAATLLAAGCTSDRGAAATRDSATAGDADSAPPPQTSASPSLDGRLTLGSAAPGDMVIGPATTEKELIAAFGAKNVTQESVPLAEGESAMATVLFAADSGRRLEIFWGNTAAHDAPQFARLQGTWSAWRVGTVTLGSGLAEVEAANRGPFKLLGFHWDYEGTVSSWDGGRFDNLPPEAGRLVVRFHPTAFDALSAEEGGQISGDHEFLSIDPLIRRVKPRVYLIEVRFTDADR